MSTLDKDIIKLVEQIDGVFGNTVPPPKANLVRALESEGIISSFQGQHWRDVPMTILIRQYAALFFFTPQAYRHYLPAYMRATVTAYDAVDMVSDSVVFSLIPPTDPELLKGYHERIMALTNHERAVVCSFLRFLLTHYSADDALDQTVRAMEALDCKPE